MIYIANKSREIEKDNNNLKIKILKINDEIKINKIELITHKNSNYLETLYMLYYSETKKNNIPNIVSIKELSSENKNIKLVNTNK